MSYDVFRSDDSPMRRAGSWASVIVGVLIFLGAAGWVGYNQFRIEVKTGEMAILIHKRGKPMANSDEIAPGPEFQGVQRKILTEGRQWGNPFYEDWQIIKQEVIQKGELGVRVSLVGDDLPYGEFLAKLDADGNPTTKGIVPGILIPGRYPIHPYMFLVERHSPVIVPAGSVGVVTNLAGPFPENPNTLLVPPGFRGVQEEVLKEGTNYINPYETRITLVDCRIQRFNLAENKDMGFPSKDGFWVSLDGIVEFRVKPDKAADVLVTYVDDKEDQRNGEGIDEAVIRKIILPNARSFCRLEGSNKLGREFIRGETRSQFEENFEKAMQAACDPLGIEILQALITKIRPPQKIASPVRDREIAKQEEKQYQQQILQQTSQQLLAIETELVKQKQELVKAEQDVVKIETEAKQEQEVALTMANQRAAVAQFKLDAAKDKASAIMALGKADAEVVRFQNEAEAAGWKEAVAAFSGAGDQYARYVLFKKMASAYRQIMVNTADSPIMKVFDSFSQDSPSSADPVKPVSGTKSPSGVADDNDGKNVTATPVSATGNSSK